MRRLKRSWRVVPLAVTAPALALASLSVMAAGPASAGVQTSKSLPLTASVPSSTCAISGPTGEVKHVVQITFDNVHFNRDNPNVLSDMEQIPALTSFIESNGTLLSNNHTPLIAHTADDTITNYSGLYGDRQGNGISNDYYTYTNNAPGGSTGSQQSSFSYWTAPGGATDPYPNMDYSATVPASDPTDATPPAPWVPFTEAGCDVGAFSTANMELENQSPDIANVFGTNSPEEAQLTADTSSYKDQEQNDYLGVAIHCASNDSLCANAQAVKYGQTAPSYDAVADNLPSEPVSYSGTSPSGSTPGSGFLGLFGAKYVAPVLDAAANASSAQCPGAGGYHYASGQCFQVTDSAGNLVDLNGAEIDGAYSDAPGPGFPGFDPTPAQSLAYVADMQESGVPVTYAYISDVHEVKSYDAGPCSAAATYKGSPDVGYADGPGDPCYYQTTAAYNAAFTSFFQRLAADGITPANTLFVFGADEGDHFSGANATRASTPTCTGTPDTTGYVCQYASGQVGEVLTDIHGVLKAEENDTTPFTSQPQGESVYVTGNQSTSTVRQLERDFSKVTISDPFDGTTETATKWLVDATGEELLHFGNADPSRVPTFTDFPKPDVYFQSGTSDSCKSGVTAANAPTYCDSVSSEYAWNHGYYAPEIDNTWLGLVGPGVENQGLNGSGPGGGPNSDGNANSGTATVSTISNPGTWVDQSDIRPTLMALTGLKDDYTEDGRVISEVINPSDLPTSVADPEFEPLAVCYKQLNSSVGEFGTDVIEASTSAIESGSAANDATYQTFEANLASLGTSRDALATKIKNELWAAEFANTPLGSAGSSDLATCQGLLVQADALVSGAPVQTPESPAAVLLPTTAMVMVVGVLLFLRRRRTAI